MDIAECGCPTDGEWIYHQRGKCEILQTIESQIEDRIGNRIVLGFIYITFNTKSGFVCWHDGMRNRDKVKISQSHGKLHTF